MDLLPKVSRERLRSFLWGMGSILDVSGHVDLLSRKRRSSDAEALHEDWSRVGDDLSRSASHVITVETKNASEKDTCSQPI